MSLECEQEFWTYTPFEVDMLITEWKNKINLANYSAAQVAASVSNAWRPSGAAPISHDAFLPFETPRHYLSIDEAIAAMEVISKKGELNGRD